MQPLAAIIYWYSSCRVFKAQLAVSQMRDSSLIEHVSYSSAYSNSSEYGGHGDCIT